MMLGACAPIGTNDVPGASTPPPTPPPPPETPSTENGLKKYIPLIVAGVVLYYILYSKK